MINTIANALINNVWKSPDHALYNAIKAETWTAHNIPLSEHDSTMPLQKRALIENEVRTVTIKRNLGIFTQKLGGLKGLKLLDLGCLEGGLTFEMAREDMDVLGIEGRAGNHQKCKLIERYYNLPNLKFIKKDVKDLNREADGIFDIVLCLGLLYHLDNPAEFLWKLSQMTHDNSILFLDTHIAPVDQKAMDKCLLHESLSDLDTLQANGRSYSGRWFFEYDENGPVSSHEWASTSNSKSFFLTEESLIKTLYVNGFEYIYSLYGCHEIDFEFEARQQFSRIWLVALKKSFFDK